jgi:hypothetical protein
MVPPGLVRNSSSISGSFALTIQRGPTRYVPPVHGGGVQPDLLVLLLREGGDEVVDLRCVAHALAQLFRLDADVGRAAGQTGDHLDLRGCHDTGLRGGDPRRGAVHRGVVRTAVARRGQGHQDQSCGEQGAACPAGGEQGPAGAPGLRLL